MTLYVGMHLLLAHPRVCVYVCSYVLLLPYPRVCVHIGMHYYYRIQGSVSMLLCMFATVSRGPYLCLYAVLLLYSRVRVCVWRTFATVSWGLCLSQYVVTTVSRGLCPCLYAFLLPYPRVFVHVSCILLTYPRVCVCVCMFFPTDRKVFVLSMFGWSFATVS